MEDIRVAAVAMGSRWGKKEENLARMEEFVRRAAGERIDFICFPELSISGYSVREDILSLAETIPGPSSEAVLKMAGENGLVILAGLVERGPGGEAFISHLAAGPEGLLGVYRKIHLGPPEERMFRAGSGVQVFRHRRATFGMELCFDGHFPELSTLLTLKGAEVIWIPHASPRESAKEKQERWLRYLSARAYDNGVFLVACNQAGRENCGMTFPGGVLILNPRGEVMAGGSTEGEEMVWTDLKASLLKEVRESPHGFFMGRRRPELYKDLAV